MSPASLLRRAFSLAASIASVVLIVTGAYLLAGLWLACFAAAAALIWVDWAYER